MKIAIRTGVLLAWASIQCGCGAGKSPPDVSAAQQAQAAPAEIDFDAVDTPPRQRQFRFIYAATISGLPPGSAARIWIPVAESTSSQKVTREAIHLPAPYRETTEKVFGNRLLYLEAKTNAAGEIPLEVRYRVTRNEVQRGHGDPVHPEADQGFLSSSTFVPVNGSLIKRLLGEPLHAPPANPLTLAHRIYDAVDQRMRYDKPAGKPWGRGDANWACTSGFGNCTDFHSLFIGACRDAGIPAKFEMGFGVPTGKPEGPVGGYHCWAKFSDGRQWVAVDISEADKNPDLKDYLFGNLTPDRVYFTTGRDLKLDPPAAAGVTNFLIYPYVEVDGKPHSELIKQFAYEDIAL